MVYILREMSEFGIVVYFDWSDLLGKFSYGFLRWNCVEGVDRSEDEKSEPRVRETRPQPRTENRISTVIRMNRPTMAPLEQQQASLVLGHNNRKSSGRTTSTMAARSSSPPPLSYEQNLSSSSQRGSSKTVAFAVNYETSLVDRYFAAPTKGVKGT
jgi:hypothetical protein